MRPPRGFFYSTGPKRVIRESRTIARSGNLTGRMGFPIWMSNSPSSLRGALATKQSSAIVQGTRTHPVARFARVVHEPCPSKTEGAGKAGCFAHPQPRVQCKKAHELVTTGPPKHSGFSCANGFNGFLRALSGDRLFVTIPGAMRKHRHQVERQRRGIKTTRLRRPLPVHSSRAPIASIASRAPRP